MAELPTSGYLERLGFKLSGALGAFLTDKRKDLASEINRVGVEIQGKRVALGRQVLWSFGDGLAQRRNVVGLSLIHI
eukprot:12501449-Alexandrium_andersonii.AAC.1